MRAIEATTWTKNKPAIMRTAAVAYSLDSKHNICCSQVVKKRCATCARASEVVYISLYSLTIGEKVKMAK